jgi:hypothetical protein
MFSPAASLVLLAAGALPFDLPPPPSPEEGYAALWEWLGTVNSALSIPDAEFRWMFGGVSIPILLLLEIVGIRKDWKLYPFLLPFWLAFGSIAFGVVGGLAATAAHLVLFPVGRTWFMARDRRRAREVRRGPPAPAPRGPEGGARRGAAASTSGQATCAGRPSCRDRGDPHGRRTAPGSASGGRRAGAGPGADVGRAPARARLGRDRGRRRAHRRARVGASAYASARRGAPLRGDRCLAPQAGPERVPTGSLEVPAPPAAALSAPAEASRSSDRIHRR